MRNIGWHIHHIDVPMTLHDLAITRFYAILAAFATCWLRLCRGFRPRFRDSSEPFWSAEALTQPPAGAFSGSSHPSPIMILSIVLASAWPMIVWITLFFALVLRSAWQYRWKPATRDTLLLYGVHSHLQQIPIFFRATPVHEETAIRRSWEYKDVTPTSRKIEKP